MKSFLNLFTVLAFSFAARAAEYPKPTGLDFARAFPYSMAGQLLYSSGKRYFGGSGVVIGTKSVLTAGHNLYDFDGGWSTNMEFRRARYGADTLTRRLASRQYLMAGYRQNVASFGGDHIYTFAADMGGIRFINAPADGAYAGWSADASLLTGEAYNIMVGYGGEFHTGDDLLFVEPTLGFKKTFGAFYENRSTYVEYGMSGGPVFAVQNGELVVSAIVVSGSTRPVGGGVRVINAKAASFIQQYLP